ncbi:unnamed protein product [Malus baccata var. baccata]
MAADNRTIKELSALGLDNVVPLCIQYPISAQGNTDEFELKSSLLHHIPKYHGLSMEDPNKHFKEFEVFVEVSKVQGNTPSVCGVCSMQGHLNDQRPQLIENEGWESANAIGKLPSSTIVNPKGGFETAKAITLRSGKELGDHKKKPSKQGLNEEEKLLQEEEQETKATTREESTLSQPLKASKQSQPIKVSPNSCSSSCIPLNVPFPSRLRQSKKEENKKDILEIFREVQVNILLLDAIKQVPKYAKFLKKLCTMRKRISNKEVVQVNNLIFPTDIYVLDMEDSAHSTPLPILLGRPFMKTAHIKIDVFKGTLTMEFDGEIIDFNISEAIKFPKDDHSCFSIDVFDLLAHDYLDLLDKDPLETTIAHGIGLKSERAEVKHTYGMDREILVVPKCEEEAEMVAALESLPQHVSKPQILISIPISTNKLLPSVIKAPILELKPLPSHLKYVYLGDKETLLVIVSSTLTALEEEKLIRVLKEHKTAIRWTLADIRVVPKKSGVTVVKNAENELVPTGIQIGWRVCIDYRKLNATTRKDHFSLPLIDQMLERRFIKDFSKISNPLCRLLQKDVPFKFDEECEKAFKHLKEMLTSTSIIVPPDWSLPFELMYDASDYALGAVLGQMKDKQPHIIYYASWTLNDAQLNYSTTEKKLLAVVFALDKFRSYLLDTKFIIYSDHAALKYLLTKNEA